MKLEILERFVGKDQDIWDSKDISSLFKRYGRKAVLYETDNITNNNVLVFKYRDMFDTDKKIIRFMKNTDSDYLYIIDFLKKYVKSVTFILWVVEKPLQILYKILCERLILGNDLEDKTEALAALDELVNVIKQEKNIIKEENIHGK